MQTSLFQHKKKPQTNDITAHEFDPAFPLDAFWEIYSRLYIHIYWGEKGGRSCQ